MKKTRKYNIAYSVSLMLIGVLGVVFYSNSSLSDVLFGILIGAGLMSIVDYFVFVHKQANDSKKK